MRALTLGACCVLAGACVETSLLYRPAAPSASILWPTDGARVVAGAELALTGRVSDAEDPVEDLVTRWFIDAELACPDAPPDAEGTTTCTVSLDPGLAQVTLEVTDTSGATASTSAAAQSELNQPPIVRITAPRAGSTLAPPTVQLSAVVIDPEGELEGLEVWWTSSLEGLVASGGAPAPDGTLQGTVTLTEGPHLLQLSARDRHGAVGSDVVDVTVHADNHPPAVRLLAPADGEVLHADTPVALLAVVSDDEHPRDSLTVQWTSDLQGPLATGAVADDGAATTPLLSLVAGDHELRVEARDPAGATGFDSRVVRVNGLPEAPVVSIVPAVPTTADALDVRFDEPLSDPNDDPLWIDIEWSVDADAAFSYQRELLPAGTARRGERWTVRVVAWDPFGASPAGTASVVIANARPAATVELLPAVPTTTSTLIADTAGLDADGDATTIALSWTVAGQVLSVTDPQLDGAHFEAGQEVVVTATPSDGIESGPPATASVTIADAQPSRPVGQITPGCPGPGEDAVCAVATGAVDPDGDPVSYAFAWTRDGAPFAGATTTVHPGDTVPGSVTAPGEVWRCTITALAGPSSTTAHPVTSTVGLAEDADGDGWASEACSGLDCDDADPTVHPGAPAAVDRCLPPELIHLWSGDGDATDAIGGAHGTLGASTAFGAGVTGQAFSLDAPTTSNTVLPVDINPEVLPQLTMGMWVMIRTDPELHGVALSHANGRPPDGRGFDRQLSLADARYGRGVAGGTGFTPHISTLPSPADALGTWMCVAVAYDAPADLALFYADGASQVVTARPGIGLAELWLGGLPGDPNDAPPDGLLDEVFLLDAALTAEEIDALCAALGRQ